MALRYDAGEVITAMVTPFNSKREIDYDKAEELTKYLINNGSDALLVAGTTGEGPTLTHEEEFELLSTVKRANANKAKIIMNAGSNCTETAIRSAKWAQKEDVDAILSVVPYYNKPSQNGMIEHFSAIAESVDLPIILYNIPGRTGVNMLPETVATLAEKYSNIVAIKQSCGNMDAITEMKLYSIFSLLSDLFCLIFCLRDSLALLRLKVVYSFLFQNITHCRKIPQCIYLLSCSLAFV